MGVEHWTTEIMRQAPESLDQPLTRRDFLRHRLDQRFDNYSGILLAMVSVVFGCFVAIGSELLEGEPATRGVVALIGALLAATWLFLREQRRVWRARYFLERGDPPP